VAIVLIGKLLYVTAQIRAILQQVIRVGSHGLLSIESVDEYNRVFAGRRVVCIGVQRNVLNVASHLLSELRKIGSLVLPGDRTAVVEHGFIADVFALGPGLTREVDDLAAVAVLTKGDVRCAGRRYAIQQRGALDAGRRTDTAAEGTISVATITRIAPGIPL